MVSKIYIADWLYVKEYELTPNDISLIKAELTVVPKFFPDQQNPPEDILNFSTKHDGWLGVPIEWGLRKWPNAEVVNKTSAGYTIESHVRLPDSNHPKAAPAQGKFISDLLEAALDYYTILAQAPTGSGKTVSALSVAAQLGATTLIVAPTETLAHQWKEEIKDKLGVDESKIGWLQQDTIDYEGKDFVVGIINSLAKRDYDKEVYKYFGTVIWDEVHITGAQMFRKTLGKFYATTKIALTATPKRKDGCHKVFIDYFGEPSVIAQSKALKAYYKVITYSGPSYPPDLAHGTLINRLARDKARNNLIVNTLSDLFIDGRTILVIGDRVEHLEELINLCADARIPRDIMGQFTREKTKLDSNRNILKLGSKKLKRVRVPKEELDSIKESSQIIFATYGMMKQGVDIPRLDAGIDVTPRSEGTQVIGRIRRPVPDKKTPLWVTIEDINSHKLRAITRSRIRDYKNCNTELLRNG